MRAITLAAVAAFTLVAGAAHGQDCQLSEEEKEQAKAVALTAQQYCDIFGGDAEKQAEARGQDCQLSKEEQFAATFSKMTDEEFCSVDAAKRREIVDELEADRLAGERFKAERLEALRLKNKEIMYDRWFAGITADMSLTQQQQILQDRGYNCTTPQTLTNIISKLDCGKRWASVQLSNNEMTFNCHASLACDLSLLEYAQALNNEGIVGAMWLQALEDVPYADRAYCGNMPEGNRLCLIEFTYPSRMVLMNVQR